MPKKTTVLPHVTTTLATLFDLTEHPEGDQSSVRSNGAFVRLRSATIGFFALDGVWRDSDDPEKFLLLIGKRQNGPQKGGIYGAAPGDSLVDVQGLEVPADRCVDVRGVFDTQLADLAGPYGARVPGLAS